jgi:RNA polymerase sigma factor (sigma-70 family)
VETRRDVNPFRSDDGIDQRDRELVLAARSGDADALRELVQRHQGFLYNLAVRMLCSSADAQDATQEILLKVVTQLSSFEGRSRFRTWLYRIAVNHLLNLRRARAEQERWTFAEYGRSLDRTPDLELPNPAQVPVDLKLLVDEARLGCTTGMLLCLDREQRLVYIVGEILGASDAVGAELLQLTRDGFRRKLSRARRDLHAFMQDKCGLVNPGNPCRCEKKTRAFMAAGYVDPLRLRFASARVREMRSVAERAQPQLPEYDGACAEVYAAHPFYEPADVAQVLRQLLEQPAFRATFDLDSEGGA